jgi:hypothetical protein
LLKYRCNIRFITCLSILICYAFIFTGCKQNKNDSIIISGVDGNEFHLNDIKNKKAAVFIFLSTTCPLSQAYAGRITGLNKTYSGENIVFYSVFPSGETTVNEIKEFKLKYSLETDCLFDPQKKLSSFLKATVTPQAIVLDSDKNILYSGRIDNWAASLGEKRQVITAFDLNEALKSIISNQQVKIKITEPVGCLIEE